MNTWETNEQFSTFRVNYTIWTTGLTAMTAGCSRCILNILALLLVRLNCSLKSKWIFTVDLDAPRGWPFSILDKMVQQWIALNSTKQIHAIQRMNPIQTNQNHRLLNIFLVNIISFKFQKCHTPDNTHCFHSLSELNYQSTGSLRLCLKDFPKPQWLKW